MILDNKLKIIFTLMRDKGVHNVDLSMFSEQQKKTIYESYAEQFLMHNGLNNMVNSVTSYALAKNIEMVNKKLKQELEYALKQYDYDYAFLCAKLMQDKEMVEFLRQYSLSNKYDNLFNQINKFILEIK